ncbi:MAG: glycerophosphodiester phosphodiesterase [Ruminococcaceae bacterium]|nr:glycerophosphodiester phosphodiesterase [Oscillospiraceae bacterium]
MSMNFAHRGYSAAYPENTLLAFQKAVEAGCHGIENDIRLSKDGVIVISHDGSLGRMGAGEGNVRDLTLAELKAINFAGHHTECGFVPICTLEEYFDYIRTTKVVTNIEIKSDYANFGKLEQDAIDMIVRYNLQDQIIFSSFNHFSMALCKHLNPEIKTGLLFGKELKKPDEAMSFADYARFCNADFLHPHHTGMTCADVIAAQRDGIGVNVWTVDDPDIMDSYIAVGCHGIISNKTELLAERLAK